MQGKKLKVALVLAPSWYYYSPPLSLATLKANIRAKGYDAKAFDLSHQLYSESKLAYWLTY